MRNSHATALVLEVRDGWMVLIRLYRSVRVAGLVIGPYKFAEHQRLPSSRMFALIHSPMFTDAFEDWFAIQHSWMLCRLPFDSLPLPGSRAFFFHATWL